MDTIGMASDVRILPAGDTAVVVQFGEGIDRSLSDRVLAVSDRIRAAGQPGVVETVPTFRSLAIHYDPLVTSAAEIAALVRGYLEGAHAARPLARLWTVPVCYEARYAPDLAEVAARTGLAQDEVVALHSGTRFHVYMVGFLPGLPYLGDLPEQLSLPRRTDPRVRVPAGAVAIAMRQSVIYPLESPGGWHLIGTTPIRLFDLSWERPALLSPGDGVCFRPIGRGEFEAIRRAVEAGEYMPEREVLAR